jgi:hypothetical protein
MWLGGYGPNVASQSLVLDLHDNPLCGNSNEAFSIVVSGSNVNIGGFVEYIQGPF